MEFLGMKPLGELAVTVELGERIDLNTHRKVQALSSYLENYSLPALVEYVPAFTSVTIYYDPVKAVSLKEKYKAATPYEVMQRLIGEVLSKVEMIDSEKPKIVEIPVCYGGEFGPDLKFVAEYNHLTPDEVIQIHTDGTYLTFMIGFAPGFPYLGGLSKKINAPRRKNPRMNTPAGSVGIAGNQTGIYPLETPGGWQIIGRTPLELFNPIMSPPTLLTAGNIIRFRSISKLEYEQIAEVEM